MQVHDALVLAASPLGQRERIEVRGFERFRKSTGSTLTLSSPLRRERRSGDVDVKKYLAEFTK
jgi:hypothetical protein